MTLRADPRRVTFDSIRTFLQTIRMEKRATRVKKTYNLPPDLIARVKRILRARTETETIVRALQEMAFMDEIDRASRATSGKIPDYKPIR